VSVLYETDALVVGTRYSIMLISASVGASLTGLYCAVTRKVRWITVLAFAIFVAFFAAMSRTDQSTDTPVWGYPVLLGFALGMTLTTLVTVAQLCTPPELISIASGLIISVRSLGGTIGISIYQALFVDKLNAMGDNIAEAVLPLGLSLDSLGPFIGALNAHDTVALGSIPGVTPEIIFAGADALLDTFVSGFRTVWIAAACFVALATVVAVFLKDPETEFNMHVDAPMEKKSEESVSMS
jgi:ABC-type iron transport system FetAB permease component